MSRVGRPNRGKNAALRGCANGRWERRSECQDAFRSNWNRDQLAVGFC